MKSGKLFHSLAILALAAATTPAMAQSGGDCMVTHFDRARNALTIANPTPNTVNQQCFITVHPKDQAGSAPAGGPAPLVEGNYIISLSGGGGGGGGGGSSGDGAPGNPAPHSETTQYLAPGVYRVTLGMGGMGGMGCTAESGGQHGWDGNPTSVSNAHTNQHVAGFQRAEYWVATAPGITSASVGSSSPRRQQTSAVAGSGARQPARGAAGEPALLAGNMGNGGSGGRGGGNCTNGSSGEPGFVSIRPAG